MMFSIQYKIAGTADLIAEYDGELAIIDYKTKTSPQNEAWLHDHFLQLTAYSLMLEELTGKKASKIVLLISVEGDNKCTEYVKNTDDFIDELKDRVKLYYS